MAVEPGWYADTTGRHRFRWHDGQRWTRHVSDDGSVGNDPIDDSVVDPPQGEAVWLLPPSFLQRERFGPFTSLLPSVPASVPEAGFAPVSVGKPLLDLDQNFVNEYESKIWRDAALLSATLEVFRAIPQRRQILRLFGVAALLELVAVAGALLGLRRRA